MFMFLIIYMLMVRLFSYYVICYYSGWSNRTNVREDWSFMNYCYIYYESHWYRKYNRQFCSRKWFKKKHFILESGLRVRVRVLMFNATCYNISVISWRFILLVEETGKPGDNYRPAANHWQILSHNIVHKSVWKKHAKLI